MKTYGLDGRRTRPAWMRKIRDVGHWAAWCRDGRKPSGRRQVLLQFMLRHMNAPPNRVEVDATPAELDALTRRIENTWSRLGEIEPHYSVLTSRQYRPEKIAETGDRFYATGEANYRQVKAVLHRNRVDLGQLKTVIDFGCGVGRVSSAFARAGHKVIAADISQAHLDTARAHFAEAGLDGIETRRLGRIADIDGLPEADLFFSTIVLQHNPPPMIAQILRKALARIRRSGCAYFQVQTYLSGYAYGVAEDIAAEHAGMEMHVLPQREVFRILDEAGFIPLEVRMDGNVLHAGFESHTFIAERRHGATAH